MLLSRTLLLLAAPQSRHGTPTLGQDRPFTFSDVSLEALRQEQRRFVEERDWAQFLQLQLS